MSSRIEISSITTGDDEANPHLSQVTAIFPISYGELKGNVAVTMRIEFDEDKRISRTQLKDTIVKDARRYLEIARSMCDIGQELDVPIE